MGIRRFEDLVAWQLAQELSLEIFSATADGPVSRDFKFRDQIRDSAASSARNIAAGFGRWSPGDFARFLRYSRASFQETRHHLLDGCERGYFAPALASRLANLARAGERATTNLMLAKLRQGKDGK